MRVLITGAAGQDGTILAAMLAREGIPVVGLTKPGTPHNLLLRYAPSIEIIEVDLADSDSVRGVLRDAQPTHVYNFGAFSSAADSWRNIDEVRATNVDAVRVMLEELAISGKAARFFQASSAHIFEGTDRSPQNEGFDLSPESPYAKSKAEALTVVRRAREEQGAFAVSGILYNHESPLRSENFVTRKVSMAVARIAAGMQDVLELGDIDVARDWGWAPDYVRGMRLMMEATTPRDYVLATGISHRLSFFVQKAFAAGGIADWKTYVIAKGTDRPMDSNKMVGDATSAYRQLDWRHTVDFDSMASAMVVHDIELLRNPDRLWPIAH